MTAAYWGLVSGVSLYVISFSVAFMVSPVIPRLKQHYLGMSPGGRADWDSRVPSTLHSIIVSIGVYYPALFHEQHCDLRVLYWDDRLFVPYGVTRIGPEFFMAFFVGYLITDVVVVLVHWREIEMPEMTLFHHVLCATCYVLALRAHTMQWYGCFWLLSELSTPFANLRWWIAKCGEETSSNKYLLVGSWLFVTFFMVRILPQAIVPFLVYWDASEIKRQDGPVVLMFYIFALIGNAVLQCYWWSIMLRAILRKFFGIGGRVEFVDAEEEPDAENQHERNMTPDAMEHPVSEPTRDCRLRNTPGASVQSPIVGDRGGTAADSEMHI